MDSLERPVAPSPLLERARAWLVWFGVGRLIAASIATVIVCAGGWWLLRNPAPPTEASLPRAEATSSPDSSVTGQESTSAGNADVDGGEAAAAGGVPGGATADRAESEPPTVVVVHVAGAVVQAGVYELPDGARVRDAVVAAGGPTPSADWNVLNLAAPVSDGSRIYVPAVGEEVTAPFISDGAATSSGAAADEPSVGPVDVNRATADELDGLPGIGPSTAAAIITERERNGPFVSADDLERVPGIGPAKLEAIRDLVVT